MKTLKTELLKLNLPKKKKKKNRKPKVKPKQKQTSENMSFKDIEELMGIRRPTYKRQNGAVRQK